MRDERWFDDLFQAHHAAVLAYVRRRIDDADDMVADVFATAWRSRDDVPDFALPWLYRTAANHLLHAYRTKGRRARLDELATWAEPPDPDPADAVTDRLDATSRVHAALARLSPTDRELLMLVAWEQLDHQQIARIVGCSAPTLRVRLRRARVRFATHLHTVDLAQGHPAPQVQNAYPTPEARS